MGREFERFLHVGDRRFSDRDFKFKYQTNFQRLALFFFGFNSLRCFDRPAGTFYNITNRGDDFASWRIVRCYNSQANDLFSK